MWYYIIYFVAFFLILIYLFILRRFYIAYTRFSSNGVKHFWIIPGFGNSFKVFIRREHVVDVLERLRKKFPKERYVGKYNFVEPIIVLQDLVLIKRVTQKNFDNFPDHPLCTNIIFNPLLCRTLQYLAGSDWKDMRSTFSPMLTSSKVKEMIPYMAVVAEDMTSLVLEMINNSNTGSIKVDVNDFTKRLTNDMIAECVFGVNTSSLREKSNEFYKMGMDVCASNYTQIFVILVLGFFPFLKKIFRKPVYKEKSIFYFYNIVANAMAYREDTQIYKPDIIHLISEARKGRLKHDDNVSGERKEFGFASVPESVYGKKRVSRVWSLLDFVAIAVTFFLNGFNNTATTLSFALHELALQPEIQERLVREIKQHHTRNGGRLNFRSIQTMKYMDMVVSETLRLWPPETVLQRVCYKPFNLGKPNPKASNDYVVQRGERISIPVWSIHRDPIYFPNPEKFNPERFSEQNKANLNMCYMPFGSGPRNCIASKFALCVLKIILYYFLLFIEVYPSKKTCIPPKLSKKNASLHLKGAHWLMFKARSQF
ncbi:unnamed protein product [Euphydryas editha]|uniref:unspecific monooxygenase n=1 Tax=Euphydryas editha TaxID=104508 RepID=A0AAU9V3R4_EUPED|nr:unnamed protein product [Euphydryas editha]